MVVILPCRWTGHPPPTNARLRTNLDHADAHGISALEAICDAVEGKSWLPLRPA
jgi:hypothetical protein